MSISSHHHVKQVPRNCEKKTQLKEEKMTSPCITTGACDRHETGEVRDDRKYRDQKSSAGAGHDQQQQKKAAGGGAATPISRRSCTQQQHHNSGGRASSSGTCRKHKNLLAMLATVLWWCEIDDLILTGVSAATSSGGGGGGGGDNCPSPCQCVADQVLCSGQKLAEAPRFFPPLSREIDLSDNDLTSVKADIFAPYNHLETLNLSGNGMTNFNTILDLMPLSLRTLDLSRNRFKKVPLIPGPLNITRLSLRDGHLAFIEGFAFVSMKQMEFLDISEQKHLNGISIESFHGLKRLRELKIESCQLDTMPKIMSEGIALQNITSLSLSNHRIMSLEANSLLGVPSLVSLNLSYGYLDRINKSTFLPLEQLQVLDLRSNHLGTLPGEVFVGNFDLVDVKLIQNPWMCNCSLLDFINYKNRQKWSPLSEDCAGDDDGNERCAMCKEPSLTKGKYLVDMQKPLQSSCQMESIPIVSTDPSYPCQKQQADSGGETRDGGNSDDEENKMQTVTNGKFQVTVVAGKGVSLDRVTLEGQNNFNCTTSGTNDVQTPMVIPSKPSSTLPKPSSTVRTGTGVTTMTTQQVRATIRSPNSTAESTTKTIIGCMTALIILVVVLLLVYFRVRARAKQRADKKSSSGRKEKLIVGGAHTSTVGVAATTASGGRSNRSEKTETLYRLRNETNHCKTVNKPLLNNNEDVNVISKQQFKDLSNTAKIPAIHNSQQAAQSSFKSNWKPFVARPMGDRENVEMVFNPGTVIPPPPPAHMSPPPPPLQANQTLRNDLGLVNTLIRQNSDVMCHKHRQPMARKQLTSSSALTTAEIPSLSSQQLLNTIATSFSELETLKRFAQLPGRGELPRHQVAARRHPRFQQVSSSSMREGSGSMRPAFYSNPQLWKESGGERSLPSSLAEGRVLPSYSKHNLSRSDMGTSPNISSHRLHNSNMTLPLSYVDKSTPMAVRATGTLPPPALQRNTEDESSETTI